MKLKNKKTGEIRDTDKWVLSGGSNSILFGDTVYNSLAELCEDWEDYEEPEDFWYIDPETGVTLESTNPDLWDRKYAIDSMKSYGNYFETKEEAELAVRKLQAWKRLKDNGLRFIELRAPKYNAKTDVITIKAECNWNSNNIEDLQLLFGGEE